MYKYIEGKLPNVFDNFFVRNENYHTHLTRSSNAFRIPLVKSKVADLFIKKQGVLIWQEVSNNMMTNVKIGLFKTQLKEMLLKRYIT